METLRSFITLIFLFFLQAPCFAQGIEFFQGAFEEAKEEAAKQEKLIFVDVFAVWCGPCKHMSAKIFPDEKVGEFYNENFINLKIDAEKGAGRKFAKDYKVRAYPTLFFLDSTGHIIHTFMGGRSTDGIIAEAKKCFNRRPGELVKKLSEFKRGNHDTIYLKSLLKDLYQAKEPYEEPFEIYLKSSAPSSLNSSENLKIIFDLTNSMISPGFETFQNQKSLMIQNFGIDAYQKKIDKIIYKSVGIAGAQKDEQLFNKALKLLKKEKLENGKKKQDEYRLYYYKLTDQWDDFDKVAAKYVAKYHYDDVKYLLKYTAIYQKEIENPGILKTAEKWSKRAVEINPDYYSYTASARILFKLKEYDQALEQAENAKKLVTANKQLTKSINRFIRKIQTEAEGTSKAERP